MKDEIYYSDDGIKEWYIVYGENNNRHDLTYYNEDGTKDREIRYHKNSAVWDYEIQYQENNVRESVTYRGIDNNIIKVINYNEFGSVNNIIYYKSNGIKDKITEYDENEKAYLESTFDETGTKVNEYKENQLISSNEVDNSQGEAYKAEDGTIYEYSQLEIER